MFRLKRIVGILLLLLVVGLGTPHVYADDGPTETPGKASVGPTETPGRTGPTETPGIVEGIIVYLVSTLLP